jgi:hypothetical protein
MKEIKCCEYHSRSPYDLSWQFIHAAPVISTYSLFSVFHSLSNLHLSLSGCNFSLKSVDDHKTVEIFAKIFLSVETF